MDESEPQLKIKTMGNFQITRVDGTELRISDRKGRAILAILSVSDSYRRSRDWIKAVLWPRSPEPQCSNSLRQTLHGLRRALGEDGYVLGADRSHVWLEKAVIDAKKPKSDAVFFEDAPILDEPFEDWLRQQRASAEATCEGAIARSNNDRLSLGIAPPIVVSVAGAAEGIANLICDQIVDSIRFHEVIDVFDFRDLVTNQLTRRNLLEPSSVELLARLKLIELGSGQQVSLQIQDAQTHKVIWSMSLHGDTETAFRLDVEQLTEFSAQVVDAIHTAVANLPDARCQSGMLAAVHQLLSHSVEGQKSARKILSQSYQESGVANAWMAYTFAVAHGERHGLLAPSDVEEADFHCRKAAELDPSNALARALIAHVNAFVLKNYTAAEEHLGVALRNGQNLAMSWRSAALFAHYTGNAKKAQEYSTKSHHLGKFSPYQGIFSTCHMIVSATSGRYRDAIAVGERILAKRPDYLAAKRHLSACYALEGNETKARELIDDIHRVDSSFTPAGVRDPRYQLPAGRSLDLIAGGFKALGMVA